MNKLARHNEIKVIGLFSGCGGLDFGFQKAGYKIVYANDIERSVKETYETNLGHTLTVGDIRAIDKSTIPQGDVVLAGIPCQPFSNAGKRESTKSSDGNLFLAVLDVIKSQRRRPRVIVFENVRGFLSSRDCSGNLMVDRFRAEMEILGYDTHHALLNAADYGVPSNRYRVFIVCIHKSANRKFEFPSPALFNQKITVGDVISRPLPQNELPEVWDLPPSAKKIIT